MRGPFRMGKNLKIATVIFITCIIIATFLSIFITVEETIPDNAIVIVTLDDKLIHSIHFDIICVAGKESHEIQSMPLSEALAKGNKFHDHCVELGFFRGNNRFLFHHILAKLGVNINSRWDQNGNWLW